MLSATIGSANGGWRSVSPRRSWVTTTWPWQTGPAPHPITGTFERRTISSVTSTGVASTSSMVAPAASMASASAMIRIASSAVLPAAA